MVYDDGDGEPLDGAGRYGCASPTDPPAGAFWSVTMYDMPDFFLVANPIERYSIGDRTPGLVRGEDGSLTIHMQHEQPTDPTARANWLPTPAGTSARSCGSTSPPTPSSTAATSCRRSSGFTEAVPAPFASLRGYRRGWLYAFGDLQRHPEATRDRRPSPDLPDGRSRRPRRLSAADP